MNGPWWATILDRFLVVRSQGQATRGLRPMAFNQKILLLSGEYDHGHFKAINRLSVIGFTWILLNVNFVKLDLR